MKTIIRLSLIAIITLVGFTSCRENDYIENDGYTPPVEPIQPVLESYDLWYVDYHRTIIENNKEIRFVSLAFTLSFVNGTLYANNNIVDIGITGNGFGIPVGNYSTDLDYIDINHDIDGYYELQARILADDEIEIYDPINRVTYFLIGYQINEFDYNKLFYDNIEYFLQEYHDWEKTGRSDEQIAVPFDEENYLRFPIENLNRFNSSKDIIPTAINRVFWDFRGDFEIYDLVDNRGRQILDEKDLTLFYDNGDTEDFNLTVVNDGTISLLNYDSGIRYEFSGRAFIELKREEKSNQKDQKSLEGRKREIVKRKTKKKSS